jgi:hypothetical protein
VPKSFRGPFNSGRHVAQADCMVEDFPTSNLSSGLPAIGITLIPGRKGLSEDERYQAHRNSLRQERI